jgi:hypothetical protein
MIFLIDHNLKGHAVILFGTIASQGWLDSVPIRFITFEEVGLSKNSSDRVVWQLAQTNKMILLTANRREIDHAIIISGTASGDAGSKCNTIIYHKTTPFYKLSALEVVHQSFHKP